VPEDAEANSGAVDAGSAVGARAVYSGWVQGVGFRFTACRIASRHAVAGYIRNLPDGPVELVAEGEREEIERVLVEVRQAFDHHIRDVGVEWREPTGRYRSFEVAF